MRTGGIKYCGLIKAVYLYPLEVLLPKTLYTVPLLFLCCAGILLSACTPIVTAGAEPNPPHTAQPRSTIILTPTQPFVAPTPTKDFMPQATQATQAQPEVAGETPAATPSRPSLSDNNPPLAEEDWQQFPILPQVSDRAREIYQHGLQDGSDPHRFSKIGDCQNINTYFLAIYDDPSAYTLGDEYAALQDTIDIYQGSWSRQSIAVRGGFNVASVFNPWFNNKEVCGENESPVECELRVYRPSVVLISMETWWNTDTSKYEGYLRQMVDLVISYGAVPILSTKADNQEGDHSINQAIARVAYEYDLPLWNFWRAVQPLPRHGVEEDGFHITHGLNDFSDPLNLRAAWPMRNLTALQALDAVRAGLWQDD